MAKNNQGITKHKRFFIFISLFLFIASCGGRLPSTKTAEHILNSYFHKYGHKFKGSDFGKSKIEEVQILNIEEVHKGLASVIANVKLSEGPIYKTRSLMEKKALMWKVVSWEKL